MGASRRWAIVVAGTAALLVLPFLVGRLPAGQSSVSAPVLLQRIAASADLAYSGYAEAQGGLALPVSDTDFNDLADLLGGTTDLRVWWRGASDWRVDAVELTGETDVVQDATGLSTWDYESDQVRRTDYDTPPEVRLPRADDLLPGTLARRLLSNARPAELSRLPNRRVGGQEAAGLRLRPSSPAATIDHVDVWALPDTGLPVRVEVYGKTGPVVMTSSLLDLTVGTPAASTTAFTPPPGAEIETDTLPDFAAAIDQLAPVRPPKSLAGLGPAPDFAGDLGSVGVYGRGVTVLIALPLPPRFGDFLSQQFATTARQTSGGALVLGAGPINLRLTAPSDSGTRWLLAGTVTAKTLATAEPELPTAQGFFR